MKKIIKDIEKELKKNFKKMELMVLQNMKS